MSKSTLSITVWMNAEVWRTIEVPCRLPDSFNFKHDGCLFTAEIYGDTKNGPAISRVETEAGSMSPEVYDEAHGTAGTILTTIKATLGITGPVPPGSPLPAIALAYEAECASFDACTKAHRELPRAITGEAMYWLDPRDGNSTACRMLAKYVEHVFEQAAKAVES